MSKPDITSVEAPPTNVRREVLALTCSLAMITYLDRICFGTASSYIVEEFGLAGQSSLKGTFAAFTLAYGLMEIPSGWWGDRIGPRRVLLRIVVWWSILTAITGLVGLRFAGITLGGLTTLTIVRFLFGAGEAGAFPNIASALRNWFPAAERGSAQGWVWMWSRLMGGLTPLVWTVLVAGTAWTPPLMHWRVAFWFFGLLGLGWCAVFAWRFRDRPDLNPRTNAAERDLIAAGQPEQDHAPHGGFAWRKLFMSRSLLCLYLMYFCATYAWYFNITYLPGCLESRYGVMPQDIIGALYKGGPLWFGALGCLAGGYLTDRLLRSGVSRRRARRLPGVTGQLLCAVCCLAAAYMPTAFSFILAWSLAAWFNDLMMGSAWATCQDIGGKHTAILSGCMNTAGALGGSASAWISGTLLQYYEQAHAAAAGLEKIAEDPQLHALALQEAYTAILLMYAVVYVISGLCWFGVDPEQLLRDEVENAQHA